jgi:hypothetical protein
LIKLDDFLASDAVEHLLAPGANRHVRALLRELERGCLAYAFSPAGDDRNLTFQSEIHRSSSSEKITRAAVQAWSAMRGTRRCPGGT